MITVSEARQALGKKADKLSNQQIMDITSKSESLVNGWMDQIEKSKFKGKTLDQVLTSFEKKGLLS